MPCFRCLCSMWGRIITLIPVLRRYPPFAIERISKEPLMTKSFVDEELGGWSYHSVDYITFPMGFTMDDDFIHVSYGRNDKNGWIVTLNKSALINDYMMPVKTRILHAVT
jgi:hypothetical protein